MNQPHTPILQCSQVSYTPGTKPILNGINVEFSSQSWTGVLGPSGCGKSTLLRCLNHLISPTEGDILFDGKLLERYSPSDLRRKICLIQQKPSMVYGTVEENLQLQNRWTEYRFSELEILQSLDSVGLDNDVLTQDARSLSGGEQQRVSLARGILNDPDVLLLDEPTSNLDPRLSRQILDMVKELALKRQLSVIMVSHDHVLLQEYVSDIVVMEHGTILESGSVSLLDHPADPRTQSMLMKD